MNEGTTTMRQAISPDSLNVFSYDDFREFLKAYYEGKNQKKSGKFSYRNFSRMAGFQAPNFMYLVIKGQRNLSRESIPKVARVLNLKGRQLDYFKNLVLFNQATDPNEKTSYYENMIANQDYRETKLLTADQSLYLNKWYYPVVREMVKMTDFVEDPEWIATHVTPGLSVAEAKEALAVLYRLGLIAKDDETGEVYQVQPSVESSEQIKNTDVVQYHSRMIQLGRKSLSWPASYRDVTGMTVSVSKEKKRLIQKRIKELQEDVQKILFMDTAEEGAESHRHETSEVCQINVQFFSLAHQEKVS